MMMTTMKENWKSQKIYQSLVNKVKIAVQTSHEHRHGRGAEAGEEVVVEERLLEVALVPLRVPLQKTKPSNPHQRHRICRPIRSPPTRAGTRAKLAEEQAQLTSDQKYSSRGRKIIPKERDDELLFGRKGRKPPTTPEPAEPAGRARSKRGTATQPETEVSPRTPSKRTRTRSLRGYQDDEDSKASEDADTKEEETSESEAGRLTPRTTRRSTRRTGKLETETEKEDEKDRDGEKTDDSELPDIDSPRTRRGRRLKQRKSTEGPSQSPRRSIDSFAPNSPRARLESGSASPKATPVVKLEKINLDQTFKRTESKDDDGSTVQSPPTTRFGKFITRSIAAEKTQAEQQQYRPPEKDVFEWEDDDEKPVPKLVHKSMRKRRGTSDASGTEGSMSPNRLLNYDDHMTADVADVKKPTKTVAAIEASNTPKIPAMPKEAEPPVQKIPDQPQQADVISPTERHLPPKLELKREKELAQLQNEHQTVVSSSAHIPTSVPSVTAASATVPDEEQYPDKIPKEWEDNLIKVIDDVAKGNFDTDSNYEFQDKKKLAGRSSKNRGEIEQLSPRARALLGLPEPGVSPTPVQVVSKGQAQPPPPSQQPHIPPSQQQLPPNQQHLPPRSVAMVPTPATPHQQQAQQPKPLAVSTVPHSTPASVIQQAPPHSQRKLFE